ncbi:MAG TPA: SDR family oxidoreductase [Pseudoduganella sp.]
MLRSLGEQVVVLTGASSGIGRATAIEFGRRGASVVLAARNEEALLTAARAVEAAGGRALAVVTDVADAAQVFRLAEEAARRFGRIDTWVNNAGLAIFGRLDEVSEEDSRRLFDINFWGVVNGSLAALPHLRRQGGALINVGSEASEVPIPMQGMYTASKHAVKGFTDALRVEIEHLDSAPVSITLIEPTSVDTPLPQHARNYMDREPTLPSPMLDPHQVADAILDAATTPRRDVKVGVIAKLDVAVQKALPALADRIAPLQVPRQQRDEPPANPAGSLHVPGSEGRIHGKAGG